MKICVATNATRRAHEGMTTLHRSLVSLLIVVTLARSQSARADCANEQKLPGGVVMSGHVVVHHIFEGSYWNSPLGAHERQAQNSKWADLLALPSYFVPLAPY